MANNQKGHNWRKVTDFMLETNLDREDEDENEATAEVEEAITGDLLFDGNGDFALGEDTTRQHQGHVIIAAKGELRQSPQAGVHLAEFLNSEGLDVAEAQTEIELQLELDGQVVEKVIVDLSSEGNIQVDAGWEKE